MGSIRERVLCAECPFSKVKIKTEGGKFGVEYVVISNLDERYLIIDNPRVSWDEVMKDIQNFVTTYVPKFGKYEIEQFVGDCMVQAIFFSKDITDLFNTELLCDDSPYNVTRINAETIKERVLKCFNVVKKEKTLPILNSSGKSITSSIKTKQTIQTKMTC